MRGAIWDMLGFQPALGHDAASDLRALRDTVREAPLGQKSDDAAFDLANVVMFDPAAKPYETAMRDMRATGAEVSAAPLSDIANIQRINAWVKEKTRGLIPGILDERPLPPGLVAVNALYFKGVWPSPFDSERTKPEPFHMVAGDALVPMMHRRYFFPFRRDGEFAAVEMPYRGDRYVLVVVANTKRSLAFPDFSAVTGWLDGAGFTPAMVELSLPRFKLEAGEELLEPLKAIGLAKGADSATAFEGLSALPQEIARVIQKTFMKVDEEGTEAAAATGVVAITSSAGPRHEEIETLVVDRPFLFALRDRRTGLILMSGYIGKPVSGAAADRGAPSKLAGGPGTEVPQSKE
jgi:serpin B